MIIRLSPSTRRSQLPFHNFKQAAFAACLLMASVSLPLSAMADDTESKLRQIEGSIDTLNRAVFKGEQPATIPSTSNASSDYQASVESRLSDIETQLRELTGKVEKQEFENAQLKSALDKALADINIRFQDVGAGNSAANATGTDTNTPPRQTGTLAPNDMGGTVEADTKTSETKDAPTPLLTGNPNDPAPQTSPTVQNLGSMKKAPGGATIEPKAGDDPAGQYEMAFSMLKSGNFANAKNGFETFIATYPDHPLISNATYWLGESYYAGGEYEKAARIFAESYKKYPKGPKVADSLLKMGMSLGASGKKKEGCVALRQLKKEFSNGNAVTVRRADQEISRLGCS